MADFGYDVSDYCDVDPLFGRLADLDALIADAAECGLRIILDWVPNHTSSEHPWFLASRRSRNDPKRDWYVWRDDRPDSAGGHGPPGSAGRRPNNWLAAFTGVGRRERPPAWTYEPATEQWYLHLFLDRQPDLNWDNPEVRSAMAGVLRFWLDRGVAGFRIDVTHALAKDPALPDLPAELASRPMSSLIDHPAVHDRVAEIRAVVKAAGPDRVVVGEVVLPSVAQVAAYYGTRERPGLDLAFNFHPMDAPWTAPAWKEQIDTAVALIEEGAGGWPTWVLSNHDNRRHRTRYGSEARARAAAVLLLSLRGTPFLFAGEELGLEDAVVPPERQVDPGGRDGCRAPIPWTASAGHGWAADPWLPWPPEAETGRTVAEEQVREGSTLELYRFLLALRRATPALRSGGFEWVWFSDAGFAFMRSAGSSRVVAVNFTSSPITYDLPSGEWVPQASSVTVVPAAAGTIRGSHLLAADEAVVLRPGP